MSDEEIKPLIGRPPIKIDFDDLDKLLLIHSTLEDCASFFDCSPETIERRVRDERGECFDDYAKRKRGLGKIGLRRRQYQLAMSGNTTMLIFLGKQWLGQGDTEQDRMEALQNMTPPEPNNVTPEEDRKTRLEIIKMILESRGKVNVVRTVEPQKEAVEISPPSFVGTQGS